MGYIYIIREDDSDFHKIGISNGFPTIRVTALQIGNPRKIKLVAYYHCENPAQLEQILHAQLEKYAVRGEWFDVPTLDILYLLQVYIKRENYFGSIVLYKDCMRNIELVNQPYKNKLSDSDDALNIKLLDTLDKKVKAMVALGYTKTQMMYKLGFTNGIIYKEYSPIVDSIIVSIAEEKESNG